MQAIPFFVYTIIIPQTVFSVQGQNVEFSPSLRALYSEECPLYWKVPPLCVKIKYTTVPHRPRKELALTKHAKFRISFQYNSPVVLTFFLLSLGALALDGATGGWTTTHLFCVYRSSLKDPLFYLRLFGHVLGHADLEHFLSNMLLFLVVGPPMEEKYGSVPLLQAIVLTAFVSGVLQCILFPGVALLGASGIVFMLIMLASLSGGPGASPSPCCWWPPSTWGIRSTPSCSYRTTWPTSCTSWAGCAAPPSAFTAPMPGPAAAGAEARKSHTLVPRTGDSKRLAENPAASTAKIVSFVYCFLDIQPV